MKRYNSPIPVHALAVWKQDTISGEEETLSSLNSRNITFELTEIQIV